MKTVFLTCLAAICLIPTTYAACLGYDPQVVTLEGKLTRETYPGPPNFESVAKGDAAETGYYLALLKPACVRAKPDEELSNYDQVKKVQLILSKKQYAQLQPNQGKAIKLTGMLRDGNTGHYHAPVGLEVKTIVDKK